MKMLGAIDTIKLIKLKLWSKNMNLQTREKLQNLKLDGFIEAYAELVSKSSSSNLTTDEWLTMMVDREVTLRDNRKLKRLMKAAKLRYPNACFEDIDWQQQRDFNQSQFRELSHCEWVKNGLNAILVGPTGVGKSYLACALGHQACRKKYSVKYFRLPRLLESLRISHADGSYQKKLDQISKTNLIILDDWGIDQLERDSRRDILELLEDRVGITSTVITTQLPVEHWHHYIGDGTLADAICDRVLHNSYQFSIKGESMRKKKSCLTHVDH